MAAAAGRGRRCRGAVLLLLLASVLAPLVLYGHSPVSLPDSTVARGAFDREDGSNLVWPHLAASEVSLAKDLTIEKLGEHKNRVLSEIDTTVRWKEPVLRDADEVIAEGNGSALSRQDVVIQEVVGTERSADEVRDPGDGMEAEEQGGQGIKEKELLGASDGEVEHKYGSGAAAGSNVAGNLSSSSKKGSVPDTLSDQTTHATPKEASVRAVNIIADLATSSSTAAQSATTPDATIRIIKDQLTRAKTYLGLLASRGNHGSAKELGARMRDIQQALGHATNDGMLPQNVHSRIKAMEETLGKLKRTHDSCSGAVNRLRTALHSTEERLQSHTKNANYLAQIAAQSLPKGLHCLPLRLTNEYYFTNSNNKDFPNMEKLEDPNLHHYAVFSDNVLAAAVVVNSTLVHAKQPANHVFHIVTDRLNYAAMKMWFLANPLGKAAVQVQNIEEFTWLNSSYSPVLKQLESSLMIDYYFRSGKARPGENPKFRNPKYLSILNHLRFYLPEIFPKLNKVLFLDDDTVVQQDLSALWSIDLKGKVNGAVETCGETFHRFDKYLNFSNPLIASNFHPHACGWAYGMNMFDLSEWRKQNITDVFKCVSDRYRMPHCFTALEELIYTFGGPWLFGLLLSGLLVLLALVLSIARMKFVGTDEFPGPSPTQHGSQIDHSFPFLESLNEVLETNRAEESHCHVHRMFFMGPNTCSEPWHLPHTPPQQITEIVYEDAFNKFVDEINALAAYQWWEGSICSILCILSYPLAWSWQQWRRRKMLQRLREFVRSEYDHSCLRSCRSRALYEGLKVSATPDLMLGYLDFFLGGDEKRPDLPTRFQQRFPMSLIFGGDGSYMAPFSLHSDSKVTSLISQAVPSSIWHRLVAGLNAQLRLVRRGNLKATFLPVLKWLDTHANPALNTYGVRVDLAWFQATALGYCQYGLVIHAAGGEAVAAELQCGSGIKFDQHSQNHTVNSDSQQGHSRSNDPYICKGITGGILDIDNLMVLKDRSDLFHPLSLLLHNTKPVGHQDLVGLVISILLLADFSLVLLTSLQLYSYSMDDLLLVLFVLPLGILAPFPAGINALFSHGPHRSAGLARVYALWNITSLVNVVVAFVCGLVHYKSSTKRHPSMQPWNLGGDETGWWLFPIGLVLCKCIQARLIDWHVSFLEIQDRAVYSKDPTIFWQ